eukprot:m.84086 g.84086  ORF g.84086 m.84086 type:complete len:197 (-) comp12737_c0_seq1:152-742(-)
MHKMACHFVMHVTPIYMPPSVQLVLNQSERHVSRWVGKRGIKSALRVTRARLPLLALGSLVTVTICCVPNVTKARTQFNVRVALDQSQLQSLRRLVSTGMSNALVAGNAKHPFPEENSFLLKTNHIAKSISIFETEPFVPSVRNQSLDLLSQLWAESIIQTTFDAANAKQNWAHLTSKPMETNPIASLVTSSFTAR